MGIKKLEIKTFESLDKNVVEFQKKVYDNKGNALQINPGKPNPTLKDWNASSIDIHLIEDEDCSYPIREVTDIITIELIPDWKNKKLFFVNLENALNKDEVAEDVLILAIRITCPKLNYVIESKKISLKAITANKPIRFENISLNDVVGKVEVQSELIRTKNSNPTDSHIAFLSLTILSRNKSIAFYVDEVEDIGANFLSISSGDTKDKMFVIKEIEPSQTIPPRLIYHKKFKNFFTNGDDYETVQCIMRLIVLPYFEQLLKWIVFASPSYENLEHLAIIKFIGELCEVRERDFREITDEADDEKKIKEYLKFSNLLFKNVQSMDGGWKKMLYQIIENEKK